MDTLPLNESLAALGATLTDYPCQPEHFVADRGLIDLAIDVAEHGHAVELLAASTVPRAAYANARAAFESALDILYLTLTEEAYDCCGCMLRAFVALANEDIQRRFVRANMAGGMPAQAVDLAETVILSDARAWDEIVPGKGKELRAAFEEVRASPPHQHHWSGLTRKERTDALAVSTSTEPGFAEIADAIYGALSAHTHPRLRGTARATHEHGDGRVTITGLAEDVVIPAELASFACVAALEALAKRRGFFVSA